MNLMNFSYYQQLALVMTRIASLKMEEKDKFGELSAKTFDIGDIVGWSTWNRKINDWDSHYGIVIDIKNEIRSGRLVSISTVKPVSDNSLEIDFFTASLKLISKSNPENTPNDVSC
jgi:hypothetical protein